VYGLRVGFFPVSFTSSTAAKNKQAAGNNYQNPQGIHILTRMVLGQVPAAVKGRRFFYAVLRCSLEMQF
jgi:hypothetical protein